MGLPCEHFASAIYFRSMNRDAADETLSLSATILAVDDLQKTIDELRCHTRRYDVYPFDTVAGELLCKAFAISRSAIILCQNGYPDEAFGLCRTLYEISIYLRYITKDNSGIFERAKDYLEFGITSKSFWFEQIRRNGSKITKADLENIERYKREHQIPDDPKRIFRDWSGLKKLVKDISDAPHPLDDGSSSQPLREKQRAISYTDTSAYVHCTQPGVNSYAFEWKEPIIIKKARTGRIDSQTKVCMTISVHLPEVVRYCLFGMGVAA